MRITGQMACACPESVSRCRHDQTRNRPRDGRPHLPRTGGDDEAIFAGLPRLSGSMAGAAFRRQRTGSQGDGRLPDFRCYRGRFSLAQHSVVGKIGTPSKLVVAGVRESGADSRNAQPVKGRRSCLVNLRYATMRSAKREVPNAWKDSRPQHERRRTGGRSLGLRGSRRAGTAILRTSSRLRSGSRLSFSVSENSAGPPAPAGCVPHLVSGSPAGPSTAAGRLPRPPVSGSARRISRARLSSPVRS